MSIPGSSPDGAGASRISLITPDSPTTIEVGVHTGSNLFTRSLLCGHAVLGAGLEYVVACEVQWSQSESTLGSTLFRIGAWWVPAPPMAPPIVCSVGQWVVVEEKTYSIPADLGPSL